MALPVVHATRTPDNAPPVAAARREPVRPPDGTPLVSVAGLTKRYGTRPAVEGADLECGPGITGILGPNGAGKSTLLRTLAGLGGWDSGAVTVCGTDLRRRPEAARRRIGYMPERVAFPAEMRVEDYLRFVCEMKRIPRRRRAEAIEVTLARAGLDSARGRVLANLSKGYRQRVGLAQALLGDPAVLILDEPSAGLDPLHVMEFRDVIRACASERAVLVSTHMLPEARLLCDRVVVMSAGRVVYDGPTTGMVHSGIGRREVRIRVRCPAGGVRTPVIETGTARVVQLAPEDDGWVLVVEADTEATVGTVVADLVGTGWSVVAVEPTTDALEDAFRRAVAGARPAMGTVQP